MAKVIKIDMGSICFDNGMELYSYHEQQCCEIHYLGMDDLTMADFEGLEFDLSDSGYGFFHRIPGYGIELVPINGYPVRIPGYASNNGYYSANLTLVLSDGENSREFDIQECQDY